MSASATREELLSARDGHRWTLASVVPPTPRTRLLWLPALGVAARHYLPLAHALASHGVAVHLHEWRGNGSSSLRATRDRDWGYAELLTGDLPASLHALPDDLPLWLGGHSLGGQLACCLAGAHPHRVSGLALVATGTPHWRSFPAPLRWLLPLAYRLLPWLARRQGVLQGRRLGFGGTEARGLIADWAAVGRSGHYAAAGTSWDLEAGMAALAVPVQAVVLADDWLGPLSSLRGLLAHLPHAHAEIQHLDRARLQVRADHFSWMRSPDAVAATLASRLIERISVESPKRC